MPSFLIGTLHNRFNVKVPLGRTLQCNSFYHCLLRTFLIFSRVKKEFASLVFTTGLLYFLPQKRPCPVVMSVVRKYFCMKSDISYWTEGWWFFILPRSVERKLFWTKLDKPSKSVDGIQRLYKIKYKIVQWCRLKIWNNWHLTRGPDCQLSVGTHSDKAARYVRLSEYDWVPPHVK